LLTLKKKLSCVVYKMAVLSLQPSDLYSKPVAPFGIVAFLMKRRYPSSLIFLSFRVGDKKANQ
jgi:hypothetical protein